MDTLHFPFKSQRITRLSELDEYFDEYRKDKADEAILESFYNAFAANGAHELFCFADSYRTKPLTAEVFHHRRSAKHIAIFVIIKEYTAGRRSAVIIKHNDVPCGLVGFVELVFKALFVDKDRDSYLL